VSDTTGGSTATTTLGPGTSTDDTADATTPAGRVRRRGGPRLNFLGLVVGTLAFGASITPSLLPRPWLFEGVICGLGAAIGYGVGVLLSWLVRLVLPREPAARVKLWAWRVLAVIAPVLVVYWLLLGVGWQNEVRTLVGMADEGLATSLQVAVVAVPVAIGAVLLGRVLRALNGVLLRFFGALVPAWFAAVVAFLIVAAVVYFAVTGLIFNGFVGLMNRIYEDTNASTRPGVTQPTAAERSGSPASLAAWDTLGMEGRNFVSRGPSPADLQAFSGRPASEPVRVYVGLDTAATAEERAALAVQELQRTGAFDRGVLVVAGTTGTGWLEPQTVDTIEYEWNGDSAIVGIQYSFLPSWISTLVDVDKAAAAGTELFDAVYTAWSALPPDSRPKLIAYGLSLGSFSMQSGFASAGDLAARTDGAVFVGSPNFSQPWGAIAEARESGSPQWQPTYQGGAVVRYAGVPADLAEPAGTWGPPRVAYVQHANDPVVWWSPALLLQEPDWLIEPAGPGRTPTMRYYPVLTFLQVTVDQFVGVSVPNGQGHNYGTAMPAVFAAVTEPPAWTAADTARLETLIAALPIE
jgi:uncharacterized membrane protein